MQPAALKKVAAILLTHWHYGDGTAAGLDEGTELWGATSISTATAAPRPA